MIHSSSIQTIFTDSALTKYYFGGHIKTYVIPCKYNKFEPFVSVNGEYWILFFVPPSNKYEQFLPVCNKNFETFIQNFVPTYTMSDKNNIQTYALFKISTNNDLTFIDLQTVTNMFNGNMLLSLYTPNKLIIDDFNNITGIKLPYYRDTLIDPITFSDSEFKIEFYYTCTGHDNLISPNYSFGDYNLSYTYGTDDPIYNQLIDDTLSFRTYRYYAIPIYYTTDTIVYNLKRSYTHSIITQIIPNKNNFKQMLIVYSIFGNLFMDIFDGENDVQTIKLYESEILSVEWIDNDNFQINKDDNLYDCQFN